MICSLTIPANSHWLPEQFRRLLHDCHSLTYAYIHNNHITGTIPTELGLLTNVASLHLHENQLSGGIPSTIGANTILGDLILSNNSLTGSIPSELAKLSQAYMMFFSHNPNLGGFLPSEMAKLPKIEAFDILGTSVMGTLPGRLAQAQQNTTFYRYKYVCRETFPCPEGL